MGTRFVFQTVDRGLSPVAQKPRTEGRSFARARLHHVLTIFTVAIGLPLAIPYLLIFVMGGDLLKNLFPLYALLIGYWMVAPSRRALFPSLVLGLFAFSPFLRRVADLHSGYTASSLILLAPYLALFPAFPALIRRVRGGGLGTAFAAIVACVLYAALIAIVRSNLATAVTEGLRWLMPVALCAFVSEDSEKALEIRRALVTTFMLVLPVLSLYGLYQYVAAPQWDVYWMINLAATSFGLPTPYNIRVFSMLNSPYSVAVFSLLGMLFLAGEGPVPLSIAAATLPLLGLTLVRTAWLGLAFGLAMLFWRASPGRKMTLFTGAAAAGVVCIMLVSLSAVSHDFSDVIVDRISTFQDLGTDASGNERQDLYASVFERLSESPFGEGFGVNLSVNNLQANQNRPALDSSLMETVLTYGALMGMVYYFAVGSLVVPALRAAQGAPQRLTGSFAIVATAVVISPLGNSQYGEIGVVAWTALGLLLAELSTKSAGRLGSFSASAA